MVKKYYKEIDMLKGVAILLVVMGHSISYLGGNNKIWNLVNEVIYNFHMPIFFFASGFLSCKILKFQKIEWGYLKGKLIRLMVPFVVCGVVYFLLQILISATMGIKNTGTPIWKIVYGVNPSYSLWFLYVLFVCLAISILFVREKNIIPIMVIALLLSVFLGFITSDGYSPLNILSKIFKNYIYVVVGLYCGKNYSKLSKYLNYISGIISVIIFVVSNIALHYITEGFLNNALKIVSAFSAILIILILSRATCETKWSNAFKQLGVNSMGIFVISGFIQPIMKIVLTKKAHLNVTCSILICFVVAIVVSLLITQLIKKFKIPKLLILGETK